MADLTKEEQEWSERVMARIAVENYVRRIYPDAIVTHMPKGSDYDLEIDLPDGQNYKVQIARWELKNNEKNENDDE